ncbi:MAG: hypothetical protein OXC68_09695 [Aestuariivita sp.]|nr:hypothetical protein [Aestuariivita sp.]
MENTVTYSKETLERENKKVENWERVPMLILPCPSGMSVEETDAALHDFCSKLWEEEKIPVVAWGSPFDGFEILPPIYQ